MNPEKLKAIIDNLKFVINVLEEELETFSSSNRNIDEDQGIDFLPIDDYDEIFEDSTY
jgi:hypothetical protein